MLDLDLADFDLFRHHYPLGIVRWEGTDPRISIAQIAANTGLSQNAVRQRCLKWRRVGFLRGFVVQPNPYLFGAHLRAVTIPVPDPVERDRLFEELRLIGGIVDAILTLREGERLMVVRYVADLAPTVARREKLLARLSADGVSPPIPLWEHPCERELSRLDWRVVDAFQRHPESALRDVAHEVGLTPKTLSRRYNYLLDRGVLRWVPLFDFSKLPAVILVATLDEGFPREEIVRELRSRFPHWAQLDAGPAALHRDSISGFFPTESATGADAIVRQIRSITGVHGVTRYFPGRFEAYDEWFQEQVAWQLQALGGRTPNGRSGRARREDVN